MHSIEASILINAPVDECYQRWADVERFPEFMRRVASVRKLRPEEISGVRLADHPNMDPGKDYDEAIAAQVTKQVMDHGGQVYHWEIKGPFNRLYSWNAGVVLNIENKIITWASTHEQELPTGGSVNFLKQPKDQTLVEVKMTYSAPSPPFGELIADITHYGDNLVYECLEDFKSYVEREALAKLNVSERVAAGTPVMTGESEIRKQLGTPDRPPETANPQKGLAAADNEIMPKGATEPADSTRPRF